MRNNFHKTGEKMAYFIGIICQIWSTSFVFFFDQYTIFEILRKISAQNFILLVQNWAIELNNPSTDSFRRFWDVLSRWNSQSPFIYFLLSLIINSAFITCLPSARCSFFSGTVQLKRIMFIEVNQITESILYSIKRVLVVLACSAKTLWRSGTATSSTLRSTSAAARLSRVFFIYLPN